MIKYNHSIGPVAGGEPTIEDMPIDRESIGATKYGGGSLADVIEVRLPPISDYLSVLRATVGVLAGGMAFNYDEIIQLRVAIAEAFSLAVRRVTLDGEPSVPAELAVRFVLETDRIEIHIPTPRDSSLRLGVDEEVESRALIESLMDEADFGGEACGKTFIRMAKYNTAAAE